MLRIENLCLDISKKQILKNIGFSLYENEILCILGANGSGKSSLLKCLLGLLRYDGNITLNNINLSNLSYKQRARIFSYVPQSCEVSFPFSLLEIVIMGRFSSSSLFNYTKDDELIALKSLETLGIEKLANMKFYNLSGGQKQLGLIARTLSQDSKIIILDEPVSALDLSSCYKLLDILKSINKTIIMTSHHPEQCFIADKICLIKNGEILDYGDSVLNEENINILYDIDCSSITLPNKGKYFYVK